MQGEQRLEQRVSVTFVFFGLRVLPLAHEKRDPLLVGHLFALGLCASVARLEAVEEGLGFVANRGRARDFHRSSDLLRGKLDRTLVEIGACFVKALPRDSVGACAHLPFERRSVFFGRRCDRLLIRELRRTKIASLEQSVRFLRQVLRVGRKEFFEESHYPPNCLERRLAACFKGLGMPRLRASAFRSLRRRCPRKVIERANGVLGLLHR